MSKLQLTDLQHFHKNARKGNIAAISQSLSEFGQFRPIVVNKGTHTGRANEILAGNHTFMAAQALGWEEIEVDFVDVDEETATKINLIDNRSADLSEYDHEKLQELMDLILDATVDAENEDTSLEETATVAEVKETTAITMEDILSNAVLGTGPAAGVVREQPKQVNSDKQGESIADNTEKYLEGATRHLFLEWTVEEFNVVTANLAKLAEAWNLKTNGEVVRKILGI